MRPLRLLSALLFALVFAAACAQPQPGAPILPAGYFPTPTQTPPQPTPIPTPEAIRGPITLALAENLSEEYATPLLGGLMQIESLAGVDGDVTLEVLDRPTHATTRIGWRTLPSAPRRLAERYFAAVVPFATVTDDIALETLQMRWLGLDPRPILVTADTAQQLRPAMGAGQVQVVERALLLPTLQGTPDAIAILPFDLVDPSYKVLTIDGRNVLSNEFDPATYPLAVGLAVEGEGAGQIHARLQDTITPYTNRDPAKLTTLIMTGVTAISRGTAAAIERTHLTYPADVISATLRAGDIVHVSNEVPFLDDCAVNNTLNNLVLCSHTDYWEILEAIGTNIVGLSGNHVNDFGREGARRSLQFYADNEIAHYGSGLTVEEACTPLFWEHNGNTFAFVAVIAFGPETAWATADQPGACHFYDRVDEIHALVEELAEQVDIVAIELQYYEHYDARPTPQQVAEFRELRARGAKIVTGVQSHVPQAWEPYGATDPGGPGMILYGLGNLFFDQMWSWETRTNLIARHTIYQGRVLNTEILTTVLEDFAQPRWTDAEERAALLQRIFNAMPARP
ncbi:MAG: CapA family protein [Litorilinea sp.]